MQVVIVVVETLFLSTLSLRRATRLLDGSKSSIEISIHALLAESDDPSVMQEIAQQHFYPRSPCGERHPSVMQEIAQQHFYPRSPCGERLTSVVSSAGTTDFYPRSPCGERRAS